MGNKKKIGGRSKCYRVKKGVGIAKTKHSTPNVTEVTPSEARPRFSRSKEKLGKNLSLYDIQNDSMKYHIVNVAQLQTTLSEICICKFCHSALTFSTKTVVGLAAEISITCTSCDSSRNFVNSSKVHMPEMNVELGLPQTQTFYDLNLRLVYGLRAIGKGETAAQALFGILNLPTPPTIYKKHEMFLGLICERQCKESMKMAVEEAIHECENQEERKLCVAVDGSWQKRGHTSLNGIVSVTSVDTGKVLDIDVMSKYCQCPGKNNKVHEDSCKANYLGTSGGMEVDGALKIFHRSVEMYNARYTEYLGDGDTSAFSSVHNSMPYGPDEPIKKLECVGHIQKRMGTRLRKLKEKKRGLKLTDGKPLGGKNRLTDAAIQKLQIFYGLAIRRNTDSVKNMQQAVWATYYHVMSTDEHATHQLCPKTDDSWCKYNQAQKNNDTYQHKKHFHLEETVMSEIKPTFRDLADVKLLEKCLKGKSQNPNESLNNVIWARVPKRTFVALETLRLGAYEAVLSYNDGNFSKLKVMKSMGLQAGFFMVQAMRRLDQIRVRKSEKAACDLEKKIRQARSVAKRRLEDLYEEEEDADNPSYSAGHY